MKIQAKELHAARLFVSDDETRWGINGVRFEHPEGEHVRLIATCGRTICFIESTVADDGKKEAPFTLRKAVIDRLIPERGDLEIICDGENVAFLGVGYASLTIPKSEATIDAEFPKWKQVIPTDKTGGNGRVLNGDYVQQFVKAADILCGESPKFHFLGDLLSPVDVTVSSSPNFYGLLMPIRIDGCTDWSLKDKLLKARP